MLQNDSLIVSLSISQWAARRYDKAITDEVATTHNASADAGRYNKLLVAKEHIDPVAKVASKARIFHYENTLPWGDNNERLLPAKNYFKYVAEMNTLKAEFSHAISEFFANYDSVISEAKVRLNGMFRDSDYPTKGEIEDKFRFRTQFMPVPASDIRVGLGDGEVDKLRREIEAEINNRLSDAVQDIWKRVKDVVGIMKDRLSTPDSKIYDSLVGNVQQLVELLPALNVTGDAKIAQCCNDMKSLLVNPETLRKDGMVRANKALEAENILNKFKDFF